MIIGGDFNCVIDPVIDAQPSRTTKSKSAATLHSYLKNLNMVDIWRCLNPSAREYSFYSSVHKSYSRIDFFIIDSNLLKMVRSTQYHNRLISNHAPLMKMSSYRPVSLIPIEAKIISKIFANRLKKYICSMINQDQTGFMPNQHIQSNLLYKVCYKSMFDLFRCTTSI